MTTAVPGGVSAASARSPMRRMLLACSLIYPLLILHGSLFPLSSWRASGLPPLVFLSADFPRYWTVFDLAANVALYLPLGFLWTLALLRLDSARRSRRFAAGVFAVFAASAFSLGVEVCQNWLPSRVPSNLDWLCNTVGALMGAVLASLGATLGALRDGVAGRNGGGAGWLAGGPGSTLGGVLVVLWSLAQFSPQNLLFASGLAETRAAGWFYEIPDEHRLATEAMAVGLHLLAIGLIFRQLLATGYTGFLVRLLFGALLIVTGKAVVSAFGLGVAKAFFWLNSATLWGALLGGVLIAVMAPLPLRVRQLISLAALIVGSVLVLTLSVPPYAPAVERELAASALRNLVGTLNAVGVLWPFLLLVQVVASRPEKRPRAQSAPLLDPTFRAGRN